MHKNRQLASGAVEPVYIESIVFPIGRLSSAFRGISIAKGAKGGVESLSKVWGTGTKGASNSIANLSKNTITQLKNSGVKIENIKYWKDFYSKAVTKGIDSGKLASGNVNETAILRNKLMEMIEKMW